MKMKKIGILFAIFLLTYSIWAQDTKLNIVKYTIDGENITDEFKDAIIKWESKKIVKIDIYGDNYNETVYELEVKLNNADVNSIETIILTEGSLAGGYAIYFSNVIFPRNPEKAFRCEYYEGIEDKSRIIYFYDTNSESRYAYAVLELRKE
jgi:hypothetical protein